MTSPVVSTVATRFRPVLLLAAACAFALAGPVRAQDEAAGESPVAEADGHAAPVLITRDEVKARVAAELPLWRERMGAARPRVAISPEDWKNLRARRAAAQSREAEMFDAVVKRARESAAKPVQAYKPPEDWVTPKVALASAQAELWQRAIGDELVNSSLALALEDDAAIRAKIRETVLTACAYPSWGLRKRGMHLAASHLARGVAIAYDWHPEIWSEQDKVVIRAAIRDHVGNILDGLYGKAFWAVSYHNNHNHVSVAGLGICGLAFLDDIPEAAEWLAAAKINFERVISASNSDGSTLESFSYWAYSMDFITQFIEGTRRVAGTDSLYQFPFLQNAIDYRLHGSTSGFKAPLPWGATGGAAGAPSAIYALARQYRSAEGQFLADQVATGANPWQPLWRDPTLAPRAPTVLDHHSDVSDIVTTRSGWAEKDYLLSVKSGVNNRNHGHLDAGAIALAYGEEWLLTAPRYGQGKRDGTGDYFNRTNGKRWTYFSTTTEGESTLLVNGKNQRSDKDARGTIDIFKSEGDWCWTGVNLTQAYTDVKYARRDVLHRRGDYILVFDDVKLAARGSVEWLAQVLPPKFSASGPRLEVSGPGGSVELRVLLPAKQTFVPRAATAEHYDLPEGRLETFALKQEGQSARYVVAILPAPADGKSTVKNITTKDTTDGTVVTVEGEGWTDHVLLGAKSARATRVSRDQAPLAFEIKRP